MAYVKKDGGGSPDEIRHAARAAADLGADIVKTSYPGSLEEFRRLCATTPVPVLIGGGVRVEPEAAFLRLVEESVRAGGAGICIGRNLFQRRPLEPLARGIAERLHGSH
ncbi:Deoxyribose-phosphate aldolase/phospho-2-dehydro-3-deoxyheptonate aldolase [mine drainage metagenome]|uniref:Deoxyribose-phosphate aldolase/phospho-2-dehydro-3-deoxyheptonate aldolase n=1 Tax=mine drainage metagenome TaxID=410659 RepID=T0Z5R8_9ZZZZ